MVFRKDGFLMSQTLQMSSDDRWVLQKIAELIKDADYQRASIITEALSRKLKAQHDISQMAR